MQPYLVTFFRVLPDGTGHDRRVPQHRALVRARSEIAALFEAKARFREAACVADWRLRADSCEVVALAASG